ncbi:unnamed protein product, partial [Urochloa humidicola]
GEGGDGGGGERHDLAVAREGCCGVGGGEDLTALDPLHRRRGWRRWGRVGREGRENRDAWDLLHHGQETL